LPDPRCVGSQTVLLKGPVRLPLPVQPHLGTVKAYMSMLASSQSSRTTYGGNARWRASTPPRRGGVYKGRKPRIKSEEVRRLRKEAWVPLPSRRKLGADRATFAASYKSGQASIHTRRQEPGNSSLIRTNDATLVCGHASDHHDLPGRVHRLRLVRRY